MSDYTTWAEAEIERQRKRIAKLEAIRDAAIAYEGGRDYDTWRRLKNALQEDKPDE